MNTPRRTIRIEDETWLPAKAKAAKEGTTVAKVIRKALSAYVKAGAAVLVAVLAILTLGACGDTEPGTAGAQPDVSAWVEPTPTTDRQRARSDRQRAEAGECYSMNWNAPEWGAAMAGRPTNDMPVDQQIAEYRTFIAWLDALPEPCTDGDAQPIEVASESAEAALTDLLSTD